MNKNIIVFASLFISTTIFSQVGVNVSTPTETFDVNGTTRIRSLPNDGDTNAISTTGTNSSTSTPSQTFTAGRPIVTNSYGVLGQTTYAELVPNNTTSGFNTTNGSSAMFMVKRFYLEDTIGGPTGSYNNSTGFDTGINVNDWQGIISNIMWTITSAPVGSQFLLNNYFNYRLKGDAGGTWKIVGDIVNVTEKGYVDILFIKSNVVAADSRNQ